MPHHPFEMAISRRQFLSGCPAKLAYLIERALPVAGGDALKPRRQSCEPKRYVVRCQRLYSKKMLVRARVTL